MTEGFINVAEGNINVNYNNVVFLKSVNSEGSPVSDIGDEVSARSGFMKACSIVCQYAFFLHELRYKDLAAFVFKF